MEYSLAGFNGQRTDPVSGHSHLGNGYRAYSPVLGRFTSPDSWSPFGAGGINPYAYCAGDPVNRADPSGHISGMGIAGMVMGALGILMAPFTAGQSLTAMSCLTAGLEIISGATAIAAGALEDSSPQTSSIMGGLSLATGILSLGMRLTRIAAKIAGATTQLTSQAKRLFSGLKGTKNYVWGLNDFIPITSAVEDDPSIMKSQFIYTDEINGGVKRLNIVGHGSKDGPGMIFYRNNKSYTTDADGIKNMLVRRNFRLDNLSSVRIVSCFSADSNNGLPSLAEELADRLNLPVQGFHDAVNSVTSANFGEFVQQSLKPVINDGKMISSTNESLIQEIRTSDKYWFRVQDSATTINDPELFFPKSWPD